MTLPTIVYHGTTSNHVVSLSNGIDLTKSDKYTDFGHGFYVTADKEQAIRFANSLAKKHNFKEYRKRERNPSYRPQIVTGRLFVYKLNVEWLQNLVGYNFTAADDNWRKFIYNNRIDTGSYLPCPAGMNQQVPPQYDYVCGPLADGNMADLELVKLGIMSVDEFLESIIPIGEQISLNSTVAIESLKRIGVTAT
ncbi:DUF3990 domain-containing protein [Aneurinibacillus thermoaerophilus]|uniref:DUF3990 domain-containing protein n=1 Tax=Aneurinibacillus thermoaerophilus TaxID=143495 RepID=UPI002E2212DE|nr:DUF3990 domain-containing protein [Aneurinibacillus thermoaerophilus]